MRKRILIVQNSETMSPVIREALDSDTFDLKSLSGLSDVVASVQEHKPALVLFEISCWQKPMELLLLELMNLKSARSTRKVILSDSGGLDDKVTALESGADDFLLKPISPRELLVRVAATLRAQTVVFPEEDIQTLGVLSLYRNVMEIAVGVGAERKKLSPKEFNLLGYLMDNPGRVFSREELLESVWVPWEIDDRRVVDVYIWRLREKIEEDPSQPRWLLTRRGQGYFLVDPMDSGD
ncbi:MAG TPA: winged helix-turn-helix domain-containing protein [Edaphobacter sp.]|nr:winged helix-turn-helix domain-containing protein [Edaphobacter sp.]